MLDSHHLFMLTITSRVLLKLRNLESFLIGGVNEFVRCQWISSSRSPLVVKALTAVSVLNCPAAKYFTMRSFFLFLIFSALPSFIQAGTNAEGLAFLEENAKKPGVVVLPSGLQYKVLNKGSGTEHPTIDSPCLCHYAGTLINGETFDSSYDRGSPTTFAPNQVIKGVRDGLFVGP